jgi:hypothetical protein
MICTWTLVIKLLANVNNPDWIPESAPCSLMSSLAHSIDYSTGSSAHSWGHWVQNLKNAQDCRFSVEFDHLSSTEQYGFSFLKFMSQKCIQKWAYFLDWKHTIVIMVRQMLCINKSNSDMKVWAISGPAKMKCMNEVKWNWNPGQIFYFNSNSISNCYIPFSHKFV